MLVYADELNVRTKFTDKENTGISINASNDIGLELNSEKTKYIMTSRQQNEV